MVAAKSSETYVSYHIPSRRDNQEDRDLDFRRFETLVSRNFV